MGSGIIKELQDEELMLLKLECDVAMGAFKVAIRIRQNFDKSSKKTLENLKDEILKREEERQEVVKRYNHKLGELKHTGGEGE